MSTETAKKTKEELHALIYEKYDINALLEYMEFRSTKEDAQNALDAFRYIDDNIGKTDRQLYQKFCDEYIRMYIIAVNQKVLENNAKNRKMIDKAIKFALSAKKTRSGSLYAARWYRKLYKERITGYCNKEKEILELFDESIKLKSTVAAKEKEDFLKYIEEMSEKSESKSIDLSYYNADCDLEYFIDTFSQKKLKTFAILLHGPENSGMKDFAFKFFTKLDREYEVITAADISNRSDINTFISERIKHKQAIDTHTFIKRFNFVLHNVNSCFQGYKNPDDNAKDFILEKNNQSFIKLIEEKKSSLILIVNDINKLSQDLLDAFTFKIKFDYMNIEQKRKALKETLNIVKDEEIDKIEGLVYDDFLRIKEQISVLSNKPDSDGIFEMLKDEGAKKTNVLTYSTPVDNFEIDLVNSDTDLTKLTDRLEKSFIPFTMLIYGPPGTGKSYYVRYLAHRMQRKVIEMTAAELMSSYGGETSKNILNMFKKAHDENAIIIIDELEKMICDRSDSSHWRGDIVNTFLTCLENTKVPFVGTTNFLDNIDKAILRRFVFKIKFDYLTPKQIAYAFNKNFNQEPPYEIFKLGGLTNGDFALVKKKATILDVMNDKQELYNMLKEESSTKAVFGANLVEQELNFDKNFINIEGHTLDLYVKKVKENKVNDFSILLYGPSGTGKSLYLRHLAKELGLEVIEIKSSDILSKWLGESEQNIAKAFEEAKNRRAMLIFDEIDSFLASKSSLANHPYHAQLVNEFLVQLEKHPYPVCGTTNYLDNIEAAAIRRFKINAKFDFLRKDQYDYVYRKTFGVDPVKDIQKLTQLTPAIFNLAAEKVALEDVSRDKDRVFEIFMDEVKRFNADNLLETEDKTYENLVIKNQTLYDTPISENYKKVLTGFVKIVTENGHGSGFFITNDGFVLTNKHVVHDYTNVIVELFSGRQIPGEVIRTNSLDVALIKISSENKVCPMPIKTTELNVGETAFSLGNPKSHNQVLSKGCITRYTNVKDAQRIETDCFTDSGSSGGPLLDEFGNVIGINVEGWTKKSSNVMMNLGINLHLSINDALKVLNIKFEK